MAASAEKIKAERQGRCAETLTKWLYHLSGYSCAGHRIKTPYGEIDLCMVGRAQVIFIEVKYRRSAYHGADTGLVDRRQQKRLRRAVSWFLARRPDFAGRKLSIRLVRWTGWLRCQQTDMGFE